jgi:hypothetical protein
VPLARPVLASPARVRTGLAPFAALLVFFSTPASADPPANDAQAEALIRVGIDLRRDGRDDDALDAFRRANALHATPRGEAQIGLAEQSLGRWTDAASHLEAALSATTDAWIARHRAELEESLQVISAHLGWIAVTCDTPGAQLLVNGESAGSPADAPPARLIEGPVDLEVRADGYDPWRRTVAVRAGERTRAFVALVPHAPPPPSPSPPPPETKKETTPARVAPAPFPWAAATSAALGVAGLSLGVAFGIEVFHAKAERDPHCDGGRCDATGLALDDLARQDATVSSVALGVGVLGTAAAAWFFWRRTPRATVSLAVLPIASSSEWGIHLSGRF